MSTWVCLLLGVAAAGDTQVTLKSEPVTGVVRGPEQRVMPGADVYLISPGYDLRTRQGVVIEIVPVGSEPGPIPQHTQTGDQGQFRLPPNAGPFLLYVTHEWGYALVSDTASRLTPNIVLNRWSRAFGVLKHSDIPGSFATLRIQAVRYFDGSVRESDIRIRDGIAWIEQDETSANERAEFSFEFVPQGETQLNRIFQAGNEPVMLDGLQTTAHVAGRGATRDVLIGGRGRPIRGRFVIPEAGGSLRDVSDYRVRMWMVTGASGTVSAQHIDNVRRAFLSSEEGRYYHARSATVDSEGFFQIEQVPPGTFGLQIYRDGESDDPVITHRFTMPVVQRTPIDIPHYAGVFISSPPEETQDPAEQDRDTPAGENAAQSGSADGTAAKTGGRGPEG